MKNQHISMILEKNLGLEIFYNIPLDKETLYLLYCHCLWKIESISMIHAVPRHFSETTALYIKQ